MMGRPAASKRAPLTTSRLYQQPFLLPSFRGSAVCSGLSKLLSTTGFLLRFCCTSSLPGVVCSPGTILAFLEFAYSPEGTACSLYQLGAAGFASGRVVQTRFLMKSIDNGMPGHKVVAVENRRARASIRTHTRTAVLCSPGITLTVSRNGIRVSLSPFLLSALRDPKTRTGGCVAPRSHIIPRLR